MSRTRLSLLTVRSDTNAAEGQILFPLVAPDTVHPILEPSEVIWTQFWADVEQETALGNGWGTAWKLDEQFWVTVTNQRIIYACRKFTKGSTWFGTGVIGASVALTTMAVSSARAKKQRQGRAAVGHVRYEWLSNAILVQHDPARMRGVQGMAARAVRFPASTVVLTINGGPSLYRINLRVRGERPLDSRFVRYITGAAADTRLSNPSADIDVRARAKLEEVASGCVGDESGNILTIPLPGSIPVANNGPASTLLD